MYKNHRWKITKDSVEIVLHAAEEQGKRKRGGPVKHAKKKNRDTHKIAGSTSMGSE